MKYETNILFLNKTLMSTYIIKQFYGLFWLWIWDLFTLKKHIGCSFASALSMFMKSAIYKCTIIIIKIPFQKEAAFFKKIPTWKSIFFYLLQNYPCMNMKFPWYFMPFSWYLYVMWHSLNYTQFKLYNAC